MCASISDFWYLDGIDIDSRTWMTVEASKRSEAKWVDADAPSQLVNAKSGAVSLKVIGGKRLFDVYTALVWPIMSGEMISVLRSVCRTSFETTPIRLYGRDDATVLKADIHFVTLRVGSGPIDLTRGTSLINSEAYGLQDPYLTQAIGKYFDPATWTGDDIFSPDRAPMDCVVTEPVAQAIRASGLRGYNLERADECGRDLRDKMVRLSARVRPHLFTNLNLPVPDQGNDN